MENLKKQLEKKIKKREELTRELKELKKEIKDIEKNIELMEFKKVKKILENKGMTLDDLLKNQQQKQYFIKGENKHE